MAFSWRTRARSQPQRTVDRAQSREPETPDVPVAPLAPPLEDWPRIQSRHPGWWQVARIEIHGDTVKAVLIAEARSETEAWKIAAAQASQVRITKWDTKQAFVTARKPRVVFTGTVESE